MGALLAVLLIGSGWSYADPVEARCDVIELNAVLHPGDRTIPWRFTSTYQLLFWNRDNRDGRFHVADYLIVSDECELPHRSPMIFRRGGRVVKVYFAGAFAQLTDYDPELADRSEVKPYDRAGIFQEFSSVSAWGWRSKH